MPHQDRNTETSRETSDETIIRLIGEINACHTSYMDMNRRALRAEEMCRGLVTKIAEMDVSAAEKDQSVAAELRRLANIVEGLRTELSKNKPRLEAAREFFLRMAQADVANHNTQQPS